MILHIADPYSFGRASHYDGNNEATINNYSDYCSVELVLELPMFSYMLVVVLLFHLKPKLLFQRNIMEWLGVITPIRSL